MKVLLITQFFWPESRTAPTNLAAMAKHLKKSGHDVLVITGFPNHPFGKIYEGYSQKMWMWDDYEGVTLLRLPLYPDHSTSIIKRALNYGTFALSASILGLILSRKFKPDVIFSYFAPVTMGFVVWAHKIFHRAKVVFWITDLWPENLQATGKKIPGWLYRLILRIEKRGYDLADIICVDSPGYKSNLIQKQVDQSKINVIPEWADESLFFPVQKDEELLQKHNLGSKFNIVYGGNIGTVQYLETVLQAADILRDKENIQFVLIGDGNDLNRLKQMAQDSNLTNVRFVPRQPMDQIHKFFSLADVLLVHLMEKPIFSLQLPSKIMAYMACGKPILCAVPGASSEIVLNAEAGVSCPSENPEEMAKAINDLYEAPRHELETMGINARNSYLNNYTREISVQKLKVILEEL